MSERLTYTEEEILASHDYARPLEIEGRLCHGGFDADGKYISPRVLNRIPAIEAWQNNFRSETGKDIISGAHATHENMPNNFPNVEQTKFLLREGAKAPIARILTMIGIVEGFGAMLRMLPIPNWDDTLVESIEGTAIAHLDKGLIEAHARDEAGHKKEGGHNFMWFTARDLALDNPEVPKDLMQQMMGGRGEGPGEGMTSIFKPDPLLPDVLAMQLNMFSNVLVIEIYAEMMFRWAVEVVGDSEICSNSEKAAQIINYIRQDEAPHVGYLETVLSELSVRTIIGTDGSKLSGEEVVNSYMKRMVDMHHNDIWTRNRTMRTEQVRVALSGRDNGTDLFDEFVRLGDDAA